MKGNPVVPGGSLTSKPTWSHTSGCSTTSAFFHGGPVAIVLLDPGQDEAADRQAAGHEKRVPDGQATAERRRPTLRTALDHGKPSVHCENQTRYTPWPGRGSGRRIDRTRFVRRLRR